MKTPRCDLCDQPPIMALTIFIHDRWWSRLLLKLPRKIVKIYTCQTHLPQNTARMQGMVRQRAERTGDSDGAVDT